MNFPCPTVHALLSPIFRARPRLIGVDGLNGCRKSSLAQRVAGHTHHTVVSLDDFLEKNQGAYVEYIDLDRLRSASGAGSLIVEGVCLLDVIDRAGLDLDLLIYVRRTHLGIWEGEDCLGLNQDLDEFLRRLKIGAELFSSTGEGVSEEDLFTEIIRYHHAFKPHEKADLTFVWNDG